MSTLPHSPHGELLRVLMPPVSYDTNADAMAQSLTADGLTLDRANKDAGNALLGLTPTKSLAWLEAYEKEYGLPDDCFTGPLSLDERITQLAIAMREEGGISREFYTWLASMFGYSLAIREFKPFRAGSKAGDALTNGNWRYVWILHTDGIYSRSFRAGRSCAGEPLRSWGNAAFECLFAKHAPAHTLLHFSYS